MCVIPYYEYWQWWLESSFESLACTSCIDTSTSQPQRQKCCANWHTLAEHCKTASSHKTDIDWQGQPRDFSPMVVENYMKQRCKKMSKESHSCSRCSLSSHDWRCWQFGDRGVIWMCLKLLTKLSQQSTRLQRTRNPSRCIYIQTKPFSCPIFSAHALSSFSSPLGNVKPSRPSLSWRRISDKSDSTIPQNLFDPLQNILDLHPPYSTRMSTALQVEIPAVLISTTLRWISLACDIIGASANSTRSSALWLQCQLPLFASNWEMPRSSAVSYSSKPWPKRLSKWAQKSERSVGESRNLKPLHQLDQVVLPQVPGSVSQTIDESGKPNKNSWGNCTLYMTWL